MKDAFKNPCIREQDVDRCAALQNHSGDQRVVGLVLAVKDEPYAAAAGGADDGAVLRDYQIARDLIVPKDSTVISTAGGRRIRLIFDGKDKTNDPLISRMVLECGAPVNILFADTRIFEGVLHGHMVIELPNDKREADKIITWLSGSSVNWKEEI